MLAYLSDEWLAALQAVADGDEQLAAATADSALTIEQHVTDGPRGTVVFHVTIDHGTVRFVPGPAEDPDVTFTQPYEVAADIGRHARSAQAAFMVGKVCIEGRIEKLPAEAAPLGKLDDLFRSVRDRTAF